MPNKCRKCCIIEDFYENVNGCLNGCEFVCLIDWGCGIELEGVRRDLDGFRSVCTGLKCVLKHWFETNSDKVLFYCSQVTTARFSSTTAPKDARWKKKKTR